MRAWNLVLGAGSVIAACAFGQTPNSPTEAMLPRPPPAAAAAVGPGSPAMVTLRPTASSDVSGSLQLAASGGGIHVTGHVRGLKPGSVHGIHIHENGDCSAPDASSAGGHFAPLGHSHGAPGPSSHAGDLGNIQADAGGVAIVDVRAPLATVATGAATDVSGKAVVVHAGADDLTSQPSGNSGAPLACGVIH